MLTQKFGALVAVNGLIAKFVFDAMQDLTSVNFWLLVTSLACLVIGIVLSVIVVLPKNVKNKGKGFIYWGYIANSTLEEYTIQIKNEPTSELLEEAIRNNYIQAGILTRKFRWLYWAFMISIVSYIILAICGVMAVIDTLPIGG